MKTIEITTPDGKTLSLTAPDDASDQQIHDKVNEAVGHYKASSQPQSTSDKALAAVKGAEDNLNPNDILARAGAAAGVAGQRFSEATGINPSALVNPGIPAINNQQALTQAVTHPVATVKKLYQGGKEAIAAFDPNGQVAPDAATAATMGKVVGTALPIIAQPALATSAMSDIKPTGPFTAGVKYPDLVMPGGKDAAQQAVGAAKDAAMAGDDAQEASRLRRLLTTPNGRSKLSEEAIGSMDKIDQMSPTQLLAYKEALGKTATRGGTFANTYMNAKRAVTARLDEVVPGLADKMDKARAAFLAAGEGDTPVSLIQAVTQNPLAKAFSMPGTRAAAGAAVGQAARFGGQAIQGAAPVIQALERAYQRRKKVK